jgi:hypothetical protein
LGNELKQICSRSDQECETMAWQTRLGVVDSMFYTSANIAPNLIFCRNLTPRMPTTTNQSLEYCWVIELGCVEINTEVSMLSTHLALPCEGHLVGALHIFAYLDKKLNARMMFDPTYPVVD